MRTSIGCGVVLLSVLGNVTEASGVSDAVLAGNRGLSPIIHSNLNLQQGEINMFIMDMPDVPPQYAPVVIAQAEQSQPPMVAGSAVSERTIGVCQLIMGADKPPSAFNGFFPAGSVWSYLRRVEKLSNLVTDETLLNAKTSLISSATHGVLKSFGENPGEVFYQYYPDSGYAGADQATFLVEMGNLKVKVIYHFKVGGEYGATDGYDSYVDKKNCPNGRYWKISTTQDTNGGLVVNSVEYQSAIVDAGATTTDTAALASTLGSTLLSNLAGETAGATVNLADLPGAAIGQTTGSTITLDTNAAGYNWFIDPTQVRAENRGQTTIIRQKYIGQFSG